MQALKVLAVVALASVVGCRCNSGGRVENLLGEIVVLKPSGVADFTQETELTIDFGKVLVGRTGDRQFNVRNIGNGAFEIARIEHIRGDGIFVLNSEDPVSGPAAPFQLDYRSKSVNPFEDQPLLAVFAPTAAQERFETVFRIWASNSLEGKESVLITLRGEIETTNCVLPSVVDFGNVPVGETFTDNIALNNSLMASHEADVGAIVGNDAAAFALHDVMPGVLPVPGMSTTQLAVKFTPTERRAFEAKITIKGAGPCQPQEITLKGTGVDDVLSWAPTTLNFGRVSPGAVGVKEVIFTNSANRAITLRNVRFVRTMNTYSTTPNTPMISLAPGETRVPVNCAPTALGAVNDELRFDTGLMRTPSGTITLTCSGGGPRIRVTPRPTLAFGRVVLTPGQPTTTSWRRVTVQNVGVASTANPNSNLILGLYDVATDRPGTPPHFQLLPPTQTDFEAVLAPTYNTTTGLPATPGSNTTELTVRIKTNILGPKTAELVIHSNDASEPEVRLQLSATVENAPPCRYSVSPATLTFGLVSSGGRRDLPVTIVNESNTPGENCYFTNFRFAAGSHPAFTLATQLSSDIEVQPGQRFDLMVRVAPTGTTPTTPTPLAGQLLFDSTAVLAPTARVDLQAMVGPSCLSVAPNPLNFGTVKASAPPAARCNSPSRSVNLYNTCSTALTLRGITLSAGAGHAAGTMLCPGNMPCPEFALVSVPPGTPSISPTATTPLSFQARYSPLDIGTDQGVVSIEVMQSGQPVIYTANLEGTGDATGLATDTFVQDGTPMADILLVVDNSCSMADKQTSLAQNFASFMSYANAANVDYHISIITTDSGNFVRSGGTSVLTPLTPNVATLFRAMVNVGTGGNATEMGFQPAVNALSATALANQNAGFLRQDASLAVVVVTDAEDQSPQPVSYYENLLLNVKGFSNRTSFTFSNIGPYLPSAPSNCLYDTGSATVRYPQVVRSTNGVQAEICTNNWAATLQTLGQTAFGFRTVFYLRNVPAPGSTPMVTINGQPVPSSHYTYDLLSNALRFNANSAPTSGQTLSVTYQTACN